MSIEQIVASIDARIAALQNDIQPLLDAKRALLHTPGPAKPTNHQAVAANAAAAAADAKPVAETEQTAPARKPRPPRRTRRRRVPSIPDTQLIALLDGSQAGVTSTALAKETGGDVNQIRATLKQLAESGQARRTGERRATRWHLITEEEQIAARAAEIEAQMKGV